mmetsp:Transcript_36051/g.44807  ORF Transcript_36051/g.44807 Transcript_36051/m.44807 type:complete len:380 (+) Transcript_36051:131-1270(+)|eukprot:CAMPEP_0204843282 /NCGR_PEP_ID=MMETSP1346-20131115/47885_1 /ASSEMBLY_ACC=CAM_ASM_000771 /TAXON_ID=215587 /ORGANISM="Aplanochytrium stocchinoi, Strain GSBS06" /LENGTH=379 /DNA_ID=CAMNT_0051982397 /DNA_START=86 /DNA_END=1225 /DNA_ORIENTATION=+
MGGVNAKETAASRKLDTALRKAQQKEDSKIKLLLLGAGESGKSTLFKQMKLLYKEREFSPVEKSSFRTIIHNNIITDMETILDACDLKGLEMDEDTQKRKEVVKSWRRNHSISPEDGDTLCAVWRSNPVKDCWNDRSDLQVQDALEYYMKDENISRVAQPDYLPNTQDIIRSRVRTSGVATELFHIEQATFEMYDVGGQRNERKKWMHSFESVTSVIFVAAISEYDQVLFEDNTQNRQDEAVQLFKKTLCEKWFKNVPFILFLNKKDLFRQKLTHIPFKIESGPRARNLDYSGPVTDPDRTYKTDGTDPAFEEIYEETCDYLQQLYESQQQYRENRTNVYTYIINSTDTENIGNIMNACKDIILKENLIRGGWYVADMN